jgi:hypothetical protein
MLPSYEHIMNVVTSKFFVTWLKHEEARNAWNNVGLVSFQQVTKPNIECYGKVVSTGIMRDRSEPVQICTLRVWLEGRAHNLEIVGRNVWVYITQN